MEDEEFENILELNSGSTCNYENIKSLISVLLDDMSSKLTEDEMCRFSKKLRDNILELI